MYYHLSTIKPTTMTIKLTEQEQGIIQHLLFMHYEAIKDQQDTARGLNKKALEQQEKIIGALLERFENL